MLVVLGRKTKLFSSSGIFSALVLLLPRPFNFMSFLPEVLTESRQNVKPVSTRLVEEEPGCGQGEEQVWGHREVLHSPMPFLE
jgi:hypothetical protein